MPLLVSNNVWLSYRSLSARIKTPVARLLTQVMRRIGTTTQDTSLALDVNRPPTQRTHQRSEHCSPGIRMKIFPVTETLVRATTTATKAKVGQSPTTVQNEPKSTNASVALFGNATQRNSMCEIAEFAPQLILRPLALSSE